MKVVNIEYIETHQSVSVGWMSMGAFLLEIGGDFHCYNIISIKFVMIVTLLLLTFAN